MRSTLSLASFPKVAFETVLWVFLIPTAHLRLHQLFLEGEGVAADSPQHVVVVILAGHQQQRALSVEGCVHSAGGVAGPGRKPRRQTHVDQCQHGGAREWGVEGGRREIQTDTCKMHTPLLMRTCFYPNLLFYLQHGFFFLQMDTCKMHTPLLMRTCFYPNLLSYLQHGFFLFIFYGWTPVKCTHHCRRKLASIRTCYPTFSMENKIASANASMIKGGHGNGLLMGILISTIKTKPQVHPHPPCFISTPPFIIICMLFLNWPDCVMATRWRLLDSALVIAEM